MRYYNIVITNQEKVQLAQFSSLAPNGWENGAALKVDLSIPVAPFSAPQGAAYIKIYGVGFPELTQASNFNNSSIKVYVGMTKGLPLANPKQIGLVLTGTITQAFGNWQGNEVTLDLIINAYQGSPSNPVNISAEWTKDQTLETCVRNALNVAYKNPNITGNYSNNLIFTETQSGIYQDLQQFSDVVVKISKTININSNYIGAQITSLPDNSFYLYDGTGLGSLTNPIQISYLDLIGNATWIQFNTMQIKLVMRGDLTLGSYIQMPKGLNTLNSVNSFSQYRDKTAFQNKYQIQSIRHVGSSRQLSANDWATVVEATLA